MRKWLVPPIGIAAFAAPDWAAVRTEALVISDMAYAAGPITVTTSLSRLPGVNRVAVDFADKLAVVRYDDRKTDIAALENATKKNAGYPAHLTVK